jgi:hypothetical protein
VSSGRSGKSSDPTQSAPQGRKPYRAPELRAYGSLARITEAVGFMGTLDGGTMILMRRTR